MKFCIGIIYRIFLNKRDSRDISLSDGYNLRNVCT